MNKFSGALLYYRIFDVGSEIDPIAAIRELSADKETALFKLRRSNRAMLIEDAPVVVSMGSWKQVILDYEFNVSAIGKIWSFGAVSICFRFDIQDEISFEDLKHISIFLDDDEETHALTEDLTKKLLNELGPSLKKRNVLWDQFEDYIIFLASPDTLTQDEINLVRDNDRIFELVLLDKETTLSDQTKAPIKNNIFQYGINDLTILDWNSAFVLSPGDAQDIADVIEFSLCQLLELRFYDDLLDKKLNILYRSIQLSKPGIFTTSYSALSKDAALIYIEISEVIERIENSLKVIGDFYFAKIYRASLDRFRFSDWRGSVDQKLKSLADLSILFQNEVNEKKNQWMEIIIILLIAIEVIPLVMKIF